MLGFSKLFVIFIFVAIVIGYGTKSWVNGLVLIGIFAIIRIVWKLLT